MMDAERRAAEDRAQTAEADAREAIAALKALEDAIRMQLLSRLLGQERAAAA